CGEGDGEGCSEQRACQTHGVSLGQTRAQTIVPGWPALRAGFANETEPQVVRDATPGLPPYCRGWLLAAGRGTGTGPSATGGTRRWLPADCTAKAAGAKPAADEVRRCERRRGPAGRRPRRR